MSVSVLDAETLRKMFISGANNLENSKAKINDLNVFPVPDGDTGTNMSLTVTSAVEAVRKLQDPTAEQIAKAISSGSLSGARGNSGVILSQIFRGFYKGLKGCGELNLEVLNTAISRAVETAYKAVMKPKEGTILTVARSMSDKASELYESASDIGEFLDAVVEAGEDTLDRTPDMLPVLKEAGVVDAGGMGLMTILKGAMESYHGRDIAAAEPGEGTQEEEVCPYTYDTEFILQSSRYLTDSDLSDFEERLRGLGGRVRVRRSEDGAHVRLMTDDPGFALQEGLKRGVLSGISVINSKLSAPDYHEGDPSPRPAPENRPAVMKKTAFIAVAAGEGISEIFRKMGVDGIIEGGQTMNPSTQDILNAIESVHAETVFILPNNKNIVLAANQAALLTKDCRAIVIPTKTIPQGITAVANYVPEKSADENAEAMAEESSHVRTGSLTYAVRDTTIDGKTIHSGDVMGLADGKIDVVGSDLLTLAVALLKDMVDDECELISLYTGADFKDQDCETLKKMVEEAFPDCDVELNDGGQPVYYLILSVE